MKINFTVGDKIVDEVNVRRASFKQFYAYLLEAHQIKEVPYEIAAKRVRMAKQVDYFSNGQKVQLSIEEVLRIPVAPARKISRMVDENGNQGPLGKIIREGDGVSQTIAYELGTPIKFANNKGEIKELEFLVEVYGDIETVEGGVDIYAQTLALISTVAKPVHGTLTNLPSWAVDQITSADGLMIASAVLPRFLEIGEETD